MDWMKNQWIVIGIVVLIILAISAYWVTRPEVPPEEEAEFKVAILLPGDPIGGGFTTAGYEGLMKIQKEFGFETDYSEFIFMPDLERVSREYIADGYNIILMHGGEYTSVGIDLAEEFPDTNFVVVGASYILDLPPNVWLVNQSEQAVGGFLVGALASMVTETNIIGFVGHVEMPHGVIAYEQYERGALMYNPNVTVLPDVWVGGFADPEGNYVAAESVIAAGADVIYGWADTDFSGTVSAAAAAPRHVWLLGQSCDWSWLDPTRIITSNVQDYGALYPEIVDNIVKGGGGGYFHLVCTETEYLSDFPDFRGLVSSEVAETMSEIEENILAGKIDIPFLALPE